MVLKTKSIQEKPSLEDGIRICIMRRPKKDYVESCNEWWHELSPSSRLLHEYHNGLSVMDFFQKYKAEIERRASDKVHELIDLAIKKDVTVLCYEDFPFKCHRSFLAALCKTYEPSLEIIIQ